MPDGPPARKLTPVPSAFETPQPLACERTVDAAFTMICERCSAEMYRMHAVWRCPACGFKTDCCGW